MVEHLRPPSALQCHCAHSKPSRHKSSSSPPPPSTSAPSTTHLITGRLRRATIVRSQSSSWLRRPLSRFMGNRTWCPRWSPPPPSSERGRWAQQRAVLVPLFILFNVTLCLAVSNWQENITPKRRISHLSKYTLANCHHREKCQLGHCLIGRTLSH